MTAQTTQAQVPGFYSIRSGAKNRMFTLWLVIPQNWRKPEGNYVCNLSNDSGQAQLKAERIAGQTGRAVIWEADELEAIRRTHSGKRDGDGRRVGEGSFEADWREAIEADGFRRSEAERVEREALRSAADDARIRIRMDKILDGRFPFGRHNGEMILTADAGYCKYWVTGDVDRTDPVVAALAERIKEIRPELFDVPTADARKVVGSKGERVTVQATIVDRAEFMGYYGPTSRTNYVTDCGAAVVHFGAPAKGGKVGERITLTARVKSHGTYKGVAQTKVTHPKHGAPE